MKIWLIPVAMFTVFIIADLLQAGEDGMQNPLHEIEQYIVSAEATVRQHPDDEDNEFLLTHYDYRSLLDVPIHDQSQALIERLLTMFNYIRQARGQLTSQAEALVKILEAKCAEEWPVNMGETEEKK